MKLSINFPVFSLKKHKFESLEALYEQIKDLVRDISTFQEKTTEVVNHNEVSFVTQNDQPTVASGKMVVWKDADATSTNPTHYIVYNDGTDTVTFASEELVP